MRIIAGEFRSRTLVAPQGSATRPTMDRARESLFNVLSNLISFNGISVLDLYAGSGALGFESLSRGAARATFVDNNLKAIHAIEKNSKAFGVGDRVSILRRNVRTYLEARPERIAFDIILADPPYDAAETGGLGESIFEKGWLTLQGICVIEHRANVPLAPIAGTRIVRELNAGEASFTILTRAV